MLRTRLFTTTLLAALVLPLALPVLAQDEIADEAEEVKKPPSILGETTREAIEAAEPAWVIEQVEAEVDAAAAQQLATVPPGAEVTIYLGTWCEDSQRELAHFWRALDEAMVLEPPFNVTYVAVDRSDKRPPELERELDLLYVPTFIVRRGGEETGRVVEISPNGIEHDLLALLTGEAKGVISGRDDLGEASEGDDTKGGDTKGGDTKGGDTKGGEDIDETDDPTLEDAVLAEA